LLSFVKVLLTSRDESDLYEKLDVVSLSKSINEVKGTDDDILAYVGHQMSAVVNKFKNSHNLRDGSRTSVYE
jgi:hypothetical protein